VRGVIFDLDGTLIDSFAAIAASLNHVRAHFDLPPLTTDEVRRRVGRGLESLVLELVGASHVEQAVRVFRDRYRELYLEASTARPGAHEALAALSQRGYRLAVATNKPAYFARPLLAHLALLSPIETVIGPDIAGSHKPDPAMLQLCLEQMGLPPSRAVYVGDSVLDVESAAKGGLPVVLVLGGASEADELIATGQRLLHSLRELCTLLQDPVAAGERRGV
jgi:phosphoglycolate phosphatase